ncbi:MAG: zinc ribbon domain-containing protein, partial [Verrucomicrobiota bacterium]
MEAVARQKFTCPACGAEAIWNPAKQALVCPYCGTTSPLHSAPVEGTPIQEHDLAETLRNLPDEMRGWKAQKISVRCQSCHAISVFDPDKVAQRCEFCGSAQIVPYEQVKPPIRPESLLPFKIDQTRVRESIRQWYRTRWFAPNRLKTAALTDTLHGAYLPYWTFDAQANAHWTAQSGYYYYTTETYQDSKGNIQTRQVRHVRWEFSSGSVSHSFDDELICGSRGIQSDLLRQVEKYPTRELVPYSASYL